METPITINADLNDILFEGRNKEYGAYAIRKKYDKTILNSFCIGVIAVLSLVLISWNGMKPDPKTMINVIPVEMDTTIKNIEVKPEEKKEPVEKKMEENKPQGETKPNEPVQPVATQANRVPAPDSLAADTSTTNSNDSIVNSGLNNKAGCKDCKPQGDPAGCDTCGGKGTPPPPIVEDPLYLDESPNISNMTELKACIEYPRILRDDGFEGDVLLRVTIDENGNVEKVEVVKTSHALFTQAVNKCLPKAKGKAGIKKGKPVKSWVIMPFKFRVNR